MKNGNCFVKRRRAGAPLAAALLLAAGLHAAEPNSAAEAWTALTNFSLPKPPMSWATNMPAPADLAKFDDEQAAQAGKLADRARDFYTRFPGNQNASRARVTEVQALQLAVHYGATNRLADLNAREGALVADTNAPAQLRYELRLDQIGRELKASSASGVPASVEMEKAGRELVREFPAGPAGYQMLQDVAENGGLLKMDELGKFMAHSGGPPRLTEIGQGLLRRLAALGKPLPIGFTAADGRRVDITTLSNQVVLVDFWATWCPGCVQEIPELKKLYARYHTSGFEIVGIDYDDDTNAARRFIQRQELPWPEYFGGRTGNKYAERYALTDLPAIWLADRRGILQDIHGRVNLEAKVAKLMAE